VRAQKEGEAAFISRSDIRGKIGDNEHKKLLYEFKQKEMFTNIYGEESYKQFMFENDQTQFRVLYGEEEFEKKRCEEIC
jgi:hypothetical protein